MSDLMVRVQEKGQVTIPAPIRKKLNLKKGDVVVFVETDAGVMIKPAEVLVSDALEIIGRELEAKGISLEQLLERGREIRGELIEKEFGLQDE